MSSIEVTPSGAALGAFVTGVDLRSPQPAEVAGAIRAAWLEHLVLAFPDQPLDADQFMQFAKMMGTPSPYPFVEGITGYPEIIEVKKLPHETQNFGGIWHSDTAYLARPPTASMLIARTIPPHGGDTEFANMYMAYDALDADTRGRIGALRAINSSARATAVRTRVDESHDGGAAPESYEAEHPVVRTHPETGRRSLFVNIAHTTRFADHTEADSAALLETLFAHQVKPEFVWRLHWRPDMLTIWDNRCSLHNPINDYDGHLRLMHRITLEGDIPA